MSRTWIPLALLASGKWESAYQSALGREVALRPSTRAGVGGSGADEGVRVFDLDIYHPPFLAGPFVCVTYFGLQCHDRRSGELAWSATYEVVDDELGKAYPDPVLQDDTIFAADTEEAYAFDLASGREQWKSDDFGRIPEFIDDGNLLFVRIGGRYFDLDDEEWVAKGPFGVAAINKRNGRTLWDYNRVRRSITTSASHRCR